MARTKKSSILRRYISNKWNFLQFILSVLALVFNILVLNNAFKPRKTGLDCNDKSIYEIKNGETVPTDVLFLVIFLVPAIGIFMTETIHSMSSKSDSKGVSRRGYVESWMYSCKTLVNYFFGFLYTSVFLEMMKNSVGEKRPYFIQSCQPNVNCSNPEISYYSEFQCLNEDQRSSEILDLWRSFPSGHATMSFYMCAFMIIYFRRRVTFISPKLLFVLQFICFLWASRCSISRVTDKFHHWWDVVAGSIIGIVSGYAVVSKNIVAYRYKMH